MTRPKASSARRWQARWRAELRLAGHWRVPNTRAVLGSLRMHQGRYAEAEELLLDALPRVREGTGPDTV